jgi:hypothetical protein
MGTAMVYWRWREGGRWEGEGERRRGGEEERRKGRKADGPEPLYSATTCATSYSVFRKNAKERKNGEESR